MSRRVAYDQRMEEFAIATHKGFIIYSFDSGKLLYEAQFPGGGALCLSILYGSNVIAASGDDSREGFSSHSIVLWDRFGHKVIGLFEVKNPVFDLTFRHDGIIVAHGDSISFHDCYDFSVKFSVKNPSVNQFCFAAVPTSTIYYTAFLSEKGNNLSIVDYHDPSYVLGSLPIPISKINYFAFDRKGELLAIVIDEGKTIQLWSVQELQLVATYKRGMRKCDVTGLAFDGLSSFFIMTTLRGTMHVFSIPTQSERLTIDPKDPQRSKFSYDLTKGIHYYCQFDIAGYLITAVASNGQILKIRIDIEKGEVVLISDKKLDI